MPFIYNLSPHFIKITDSHSNAHFYIIIDESFESVSLYKKKKKNLQSSIFSITSTHHYYKQLRKIELQLQTE